MTRLIKYLHQVFLDDLWLMLLFIVIILIPLAVILAPLWWWSRSFLFIPNLFRSLTARSIALIVFGGLIGIYMAFAMRDLHFFSKKTLQKRVSPSVLYLRKESRILFIFSLVFYLVFLFIFLTVAFGSSPIVWREAYVVAVILIFPLYFGPMAGMFVGLFIWFWLYVLKFVYYGLRGELEEV